MIKNIIITLSNGYGCNCCRKSNILDNNGDVCMVSAIIYLVVMCLCKGREHYLVILHGYRIIYYFVRSKYMRRQTVMILKPFKYFI